MKAETSPSVISNKTHKKDLQELSTIRKDGPSLVVCDLPSSSNHKRNKCTSAHNFPKFVHQCKFRHFQPQHDVGVASACGENMGVCGQCLGKDHLSGGLCALNRQPWGEIDWLPGLPSKETAQKEKHEGNIISLLQQLPPKKRICMLTAAESQGQILDFPAEDEACMASVHGRSDFRVESQGTVKPLAKSPKWLQRRYKLLSEIA